MVTKPDTQVETAADSSVKDMDKYVYDFYKNQIDYYRQKASYNKKNYKSFRTLTTVLGALVTLVASLTTSRFITASEWVEGIFTIATPMIAAALTIINALSQNFQWGATWRDMSVSAHRLETERDRFLTTPLEKRNYKRELEIINQIVLQETKAFFQRVLDSDVVPTAPPDGEQE